MVKSVLPVLSTLLATALGERLWDGRFNDLESSEDLNDFGPYQYYIHGSGDVTDYVNLSPDFGNPADTSSKQGAKITIDSTAKWKSDMWRTELIPQTDAAINSGKVYYHFSMKHNEENAPNPNFEHQVCFFESHFIEMKFGWINGQSANGPDPQLRWYANSNSQWDVTFEPGVRHNIAFEIDFDSGELNFYHPTSGEDLILTEGPVTASASSNGAGWHLGVLRLPQDGEDTTAAEDWYPSGVYVESGTLTKSVVGPTA